jgi:hypothetical protein
MWKPMINLDAVKKYAKGGELLETPAPGSMEDRANSGVGPNWKNSVGYADPTVQYNRALESMQGELKNMRGPKLQKAMADRADDLADLNRKKLAAENYQQTGLAPWEQPRSAVAAFAPRAAGFEESNASAESSVAGDPAALADLLGLTDRLDYQDSGPGNVLAPAPLPEDQEYQMEFQRRRRPLLGMVRGGRVPDLRKGGQVSGGPPGVDTVPALIDGQVPAAFTNGEYALPVKTVQQVGKPVLDELVVRTTGQKPVGYAEGGLLSGWFKGVPRGEERAAQIEAAVNGAVAPVPTQAPSPAPEETPAGKSMADIMREIRAKNPPQGYATGGIIIEPGYKARVTPSPSVSEPPIRILPPTPKTDAELIDEYVRQMAQEPPTRRTTVGPRPLSPEAQRYIAARDAPATVKAMPAAAKGGVAANIAKVAGPVLKVAAKAATPAMMVADALSGDTDYNQHWLPNTSLMTRSAAEDADYAWNKGNYSEALGHAVRGIGGGIAGLGADTANFAAAATQPIWRIAKTAVTGEAVPEREMMRTGLFGYGGIDSPQVMAAPPSTVLPPATDSTPSTPVMAAVSDNRLGPNEQPLLPQLPVSRMRNSLGISPAFFDQDRYNPKEYQAAAAAYKKSDDYSDPMFRSALGTEVPTYDNSSITPELISRLQTTPSIAAMRGPSPAAQAADLRQEQQQKAVDYTRRWLALPEKDRGRMPDQVADVLGEPRREWGSHKLIQPEQQDLSKLLPLLNYQRGLVNDQRAAAQGAFANRLDAERFEGERRKELATIQDHYVERAEPFIQKAATDFPWMQEDVMPFFQQAARVDPGDPGRAVSMLAGAYTAMAGDDKTEAFNLNGTSVSRAQAIAILNGEKPFDEWLGLKGPGSDWYEKARKMAAQKVQEFALAALGDRE